MWKKACGGRTFYFSTICEAMASKYKKVQNLFVGCENSKIHTNIPTVYSNNKININEIVMIHWH